jgi:predicted DNA-binding transcriptional regulator YafY
MLNQHKILRVLQFISFLEQEPSKTVVQLASLLDTTDRTVYRYLDLVKECGFDLQRDKINRFFIVNDRSNGVRFTPEEADFLKQLVLTNGRKSKLKDTVLSKIYLSSDAAIVAGHLINVKNGKIVERLSLAIANKEQVILKKYQSINSETISDRVVEPFGFTDNYCTVMAFEPASLKNKTYNIDRITAIEFNNQRCLFESDYEQQIPDAFGFSFSGKMFPVNLELTLKQYLLLKNDFPMTAPYFKFNAKKDLYELNIEVNDLTPVERFLRGMDGNL